MVLDTTADDWVLTTSWQNESTGAFEEVKSYTYVDANPAITHVGFGVSAGNGTDDPLQTGSTVDNFSLTVIPEPTTIGLLTMSSVAVLFVRRLAM